MDYRRCVILLFDGARFDVFSNLLKNGHLPNINRHTLTDGTFLKGYSSLCTTTGPAHIPFIYGTYPGNANVPGIRWFDKINAKRNLMSNSGMRSYVGPGCYYMGTDVSRAYVPLYKFFSSPVGIFSSLDRNHGRFEIKSNSRHKLQKALYYTFAHCTNRWEVADYAAARSVRKYIERGSDFIFSVFPGIDEITHLYHPTHRKVLKQYLELDRLVGMMFKGLSSEELRKTLLFIVSDHGLSSTHTHISLVNLSKEEGYKPIFYPKIFRKDYDIAIMESGNALASVYFMEPANDRSVFYGEITAIDRNRRFINRILSHDGIDFIAYRVDGSSLGIRNRKGETILGFGRNGCVEVTNTGDNPLGFRANGSGIPLSKSLDLTVDTPYPDSIGQIRQLFCSGRTGDLVVSAKEGFDLREKHEWPEHKSSHGSLSKSHMEVPICANIRLNSPSCRTVDIFPTILHRLGYDVPDNIDGQIIR
ncbi:alkaline phosphatase family protein [Candidatus Poribacteria bacterium]